MSDSTKIILVRHGQSIGNLTRTFLGHTDLDLSEMGYLQAKTTAERLKNEKIDKIYSSDLKRAYNTALFHAKIRNLDVISSVNLREAFAGEWEGKNVDELIEIWGMEMFADQWKARFGLFTFPAGESIKDAGIRFYNEILAISRQNQGKTILIAAHAAVIRAFWAIISGVAWENVADTIPFATNASYSVLTFDGKKFIPLEYSNDEHLLGVGITKVNLI